MEYIYKIRDVNKRRSKQRKVTGRSFKQSSAVVQTVWTVTGVNSCFLSGVWKWFCSVWSMVLLCPPCWIVLELLLEAFRHKLFSAWVWLESHEADFTSQSTCNPSSSSLGSFSTHSKELSCVKWVLWVFEGAGRVTEWSGIGGLIMGWDNRWWQRRNVVISCESSRDSGLHRVPSNSHFWWTSSYSNISSI